MPEIKDDSSSDYSIPNIIEESDGFSNLLSGSDGKFLTSSGQLPGRLKTLTSLKSEDVVLSPSASDDQIEEEQVITIDEDESLEPTDPFSTDELQRQPKPAAFRED